MPHSWNEKLLILTKTYPNPSGKHRETTCVAALSGDNELMRLFPVPYRLLEGSQKFSKWEWVNSTVHKAEDDHRPESHRLHVETLQRTGTRIGTEKGWRQRLSVIQDHLVDGFNALESRRITSGETLGFVGPAEIIDLDIRTAKATEWTESEIRKLTQESLFDSDDVKNRKQLRKLPHEFRYTYRLKTKDGIEKNTHMLTDWEVGALYWHCRRTHDHDWAELFREKFVDEFSKKDMYFLMGTVHRFPGTWLIVGIYYPPSADRRGPQQFGLF